MLNTAEYRYLDNFTSTPVTMLAGDLRDAFRSYTGWLTESVTSVAPVMLDGSISIPFIYTTYSNWKVESVTSSAPTIQDGSIAMVLVVYTRWATENVTSAAPVILDGTFT